MYILTHFHLYFLKIVSMQGLILASLVEAKRTSRLHKERFRVFSLVSDGLTSAGSETASALVTLCRRKSCRDQLLLWREYQATAIMLTSSL